MLLVLAACGRVHFDPLPPGSGPGGDGGGARDSTTIGGDGMITADGAVTACAFAIPVQQGVRKMSSTCLGHDLVTGCGPAGTQEVVFSFTPPTSGGYSMQAYDTGTNNITNSVALLNASCTAKSGNCAGILGIQLPAGTSYFVVEASSGGCANIDFLAQ